MSAPEIISLARERNSRPRRVCPCGNALPKWAKKHCGPVCARDAIVAGKSRRHREAREKLGLVCSCGRPLPPRKRKHCSDECQAEAGRPRLQAKAKAYTAWRVEVARAYKADVQPERRDNHIYLTNCEVCDAPIEQLPLTALGHRPRNQRRCYCSNECKRVAQRNRNRDLEWDIRDWKKQEI